MKNIKTIFILLFLAFSISVKADTVPRIDIKCDNDKIASNQDINCKMSIVYENMMIDDIEMDYDTELDVMFNSSDGFTISNNGNHLKIHAEKTLFDEIMSSEIICSFSLASDILNSNSQDIKFSNIKIIKEDGNVSLNNVTQTFTTILPEKVDNLDDNAYLDSISIDGVLISGFDKEKLEYANIIVNNPVIFIDAKRSSDKSTATGLGNVLIKEGETVEREIIVTAENGDKKIYKLTITNEIVKEKSKNNTIKILEIYNNEEIFNFSFDSKKIKYDIKLNKDVANLTIKATLDDDKAEFVPKYGPRDILLEYGINNIDVKVKAENGDIKVYTLNITRPDNREKDNTLSSLRINGENVNLADEKLEIKVGNNVNRTIIEATPNSEKSTVQFEDIDLHVGDNEVNITVTSENGQSNEYDVNVIREEEKIIFESLEITGYDLNFNKDVVSYDLEINQDTKELNIIINPTNIESEILNNSNLKDGSKILIKVIDDEKTYEYTINIHKASNVMDYVCYGVFGLGVLSLISSIIYVIKKRK